MQRQSSPVERWSSFRGSGQSRRTPVRRALGTGTVAEWGVVMRGCVLGGRCRSSARAFGAAGVISLMNQDPSGMCGSRRSALLGQARGVASGCVRRIVLHRGGQK